MNDVQFNRLDLNLLRVLDAVIHNGGVQQAADQLSLTPSAVSHSLARLRVVLGDDLFIRQAGGLRPTPFVSRIAADLRSLLEKLRLLVADPVFVPAFSERRFTIMCSAYVSALFMPDVFAILQRIAPKVQLNLRSSDGIFLDDLDAGHCDLAFGRFGKVPDRYETVDLFEEKMVWVVRAGHPLTRTRPSLEKLMATPQVVISVRGDDNSKTFIFEDGLQRLSRRDDETVLSELLKAQNIKRHIALTVPDGPTALHYLQTTNLAALVPRRVVARFGRLYDLRIIEPPYESPPTKMSMLWHRNFGNYPASQWLRSVVLEAGRLLDAEG